MPARWPRCGLHPKSTRPLYQCFSALIRAIGCWVLELLDHQRPRKDWLVDYAAALARLHTAPIADDAGSLPTWSGPTRDDIDSFLGLAQMLDVAMPLGLRPELDALVDRLTRTSGNSLLHGDPCPGNDMHTRNGVMFIDFEQAALGNGLVELAYLRIGFPTCWCATAPGPALLDAAETAYRVEWRNATGTEVCGDLADACAGWLLQGDALVERSQRETIDHLAKIPNRDWKWGTATARDRLLHRLQVVGRMGAESVELMKLGRIAVAMREKMLTRWPKLQPLPSQRP